MRQRFSILCAIVIVLCVNPMIAQTPQTQPPYQAVTDKFFDLLKQDKTADAIDFLFSTNPMMKKVPDKVEQLKGQFSTLRSMNGPYVSHALLVESKVAGIYIYQHYLVAYERGPISVRITYYKPGATWVCQSLQFDTALDEVIQKVSDSNIRMDTK